ncbi:hypothetical protein QJS66_11165 [Kocuria rhizophila]|nr:hypothetical protein QJS66_11165 [Kocuria rhizophila]
MTAAEANQLPRSSRILGTPRQCLGATHMGAEPGLHGLLHRDQHCSPRKYGEFESLVSRSSKVGAILAFLVVGILTPSRSDPRPRGRAVQLPGLRPHRDRRCGAGLLIVIFSSRRHRDRGDRRG